MVDFTTDRRERLDTILSGEATKARFYGNFLLEIG